MVVAAARGAQERDAGAGVPEQASWKVLRLGRLAMALRASRQHSQSLTLQYHTIASYRAESHRATHCASGINGHEVPGPSILSSVSLTRGDRSRMGTCSSSTPTLPA